MFRFSIFRIPVEVQPFFWITMVILGLPSNGKDDQSLFHIVLFVLAGFISVLVHELGHALTARAFGADVQIVLEAFGGHASYTGAAMGRMRSFFITAAGPVIQIFLGVAAWLIQSNLPESAGSEGMFFLEILTIISLFWAILNLLPILPLDGGQILHAILGPARIKITLWTSIVTAILVGALMLLTSMGIFFPIFMGMFAWQAYQALKQTP